MSKGKHDAVIVQEKTVVMSEGQFRSILENAISKAQQGAYLAAKRDAKREAKREQEVRAKQSFNAYRETEKRLYGYPVIGARIVALGEELADLVEDPYLPGHSKDICLYSPSNERLTEEEIINHRKNSLLARIDADMAEVKKIDAGLLVVKGYPYYKALRGKYFAGKSPELLAKELECDASTIYRSLKPMVNALAVWLYGEQAYVVPGVGEKVKK